MKKGKKLCYGLLALMMLTMSVPTVAQAQDDVSVYGQDDERATVKKWVSVTKFYSDYTQAEDKIYFSGKVDGVNCSGYIKRVSLVFDPGSTGWTAKFEGYVYSS